MLLTQDRLGKTATPSAGGTFGRRDPARRRGAGSGVQSADSSGRRTDRQSRFEKWRSDLALLKQINQEEGCTVVMVTHSQEAARYGDRTIFLRDGRVETSGFLMLRLAEHGLMAPCEAPPAAHGADFFWDRPRRCGHCGDRGGESLADHLVSIDHRSDRRQSGVAGRQRRERYRRIFVSAYSRHARVSAMPAAAVEGFLARRGRAGRAAVCLWRRLCSPISRFATINSSMRSSASIRRWILLLNRIPSR